MQGHKGFKLPSRSYTEMVLRSINALVSEYSSVLLRLLLNDKDKVTNARICITRNGEGS